MAETFADKNLVRQELPATIATLYTVAASTSTIIKTIHVVNTTSSTVDLTLHLVDSGDTADDSNVLFKALAIKGNKILDYCSWKILDTAGDTIRGFASSASALTIHVDGAETVTTP